MWAEVADRCNEGASQTPSKFTLTPTADQHRAILRLLFRNAPENVAEQGDLLKSMQMLLARAFS